MSVDQIVTAFISLIAAIGFSAFVRPVRQEEVLKTELELLALSEKYPTINREVLKVAQARAQAMAKIPGWVEIIFAWLIAAGALASFPWLSAKIVVDPSTAGAIGNVSLGYAAGAIGAFVVATWLGLWGWLRVVERRKKKGVTPTSPPAGAGAEG